MTMLSRITRVACALGLMMIFVSPALMQRPHKSLGKISETDIHSAEKRSVGPDNDLKTFQSSTQSVKLTNITAFTRDKILVWLDVDFRYMLRKDELPLLQKEWGQYYQVVINTSAVDEVKGAATYFYIRDMIQNHSEVESRLYMAVRERLGGRCCAKNCTSFDQACPPGCVVPTLCRDYMKGLHVDVTHFRFAAVHFSDDVKNRLLQLGWIPQQNINQPKVGRRVTKETFDDDETKQCDISKKYSSCPTGKCCVRDEFIPKYVYCKSISREGGHCSTRVTESECRCLSPLRCIPNVISATFVSLYGRCRNISSTGITIG